MLSIAQHAPTNKAKLMKAPLSLLKTESGIIQKLWASLILGFVVGQPTAYASVITQTFESSWSVDVWDYNGDLAAMEWEYQTYRPWDSDLGILTSVEIFTEFEGTRDDAAEPLRIRSSFFTGWNPVKYQFSQTENIAAGDRNFSGTWSSSYTTPDAIASVTDYEYFTGVYDSGAGSGGAWYYFESRTENAAHTIAAKTTLSYRYDSVSVSEPGSLGLIGFGLAGLVLARSKRLSRS